jgi:hypothetical protein
MLGMLSVSECTWRSVIKVSASVEAILFRQSYVVPVFAYTREKKQSNNFQQMKA